MLLNILASLFVLALSVSANEVNGDPIPSSIRAHWMRRAITALTELTGSPCPSEAFGAVIVNHTSSPEGELVCLGVNTIKKDGNPTLHGNSSCPFFS